MSITLDGTALPDDIQWTDKYDWSPVEMAQEYSLTGALVVDAMPRQAGRNITLEPESDDAAWMTTGTLDALYAKAADPGRVMALSIGGDTYSVMFRHDDGAIAARPVVRYSEYDDTDYHIVTLRLIEV